jgi:hypothetical protein
MKITADLSKGTLLANGAVFPITNKVRSYKEGTRLSSEVALSLPDRLPYDPRTFPKGLWNVTGLHWQKEKRFDLGTYGPVKIITDASQMVNVWKLDENGDYLDETVQQVKDSGYLLHYSGSNTTLGCIRLNSAEDAILIASFIQRVFDRGEAVQLEVA